MKETWLLRVDLPVTLEQEYDVKTFSGSESFTKDPSLYKLKE